MKSQMASASANLSVFGKEIAWFLVTKTASFSSLLIPTEAETVNNSEDLVSLAKNKLDKKKADLIVQDLEQNNLQQPHS